jgi:signal transduction histidine kinase
MRLIFAPFGPGPYYITNLTGFFQGTVRPHIETTRRSGPDLLASATANLIDNALKYAGSLVKVQVRATQGQNTVSIVVQDNGLGIPAEERAKVTKRFYRLDRSRSLPGNGLGLPIVAAISHLHSGTLFLEDAAPGLIARIVLPRVDAATLPNVNVSETARIGSAK